ncbi:CARDB domain-containing protein [Phenylobacterium sp.]|uniref:CARDB domain-containing protein n=1 Tax=Phenylobacterium sp. TaxID=1871053 RepID=UPI003BA9F17A
MRSLCLGAALACSLALPAAAQRDGLAPVGGGVATSKDPDLVITSTWLATAANTNPMGSVLTNQPFQACFTVKNQTGGASPGFRVAATPAVAGATSFRDLGPLAAGTSKTGCLGYATSGTNAVLLKLTADSLGQVPEQNETNNTKFLTLGLSTPPDLIITSAWFQSMQSSAHISVVAPGQAFTFCFQVKNMGQVGVGGFQVQGTALAGAAAPTTTITTLAGGALKVGCLYYGAGAGPVGTRSLSISVDSAQAVAEADEVNNTLSGFTLTVQN